MDTITSLIARWQALDLMGLPPRLWEPSVLLAPVLWCVARVVLCLVAGMDFRRTLRALPPDVRRWESRGLGRRFQIVRTGAGPAAGGAEGPAPSETRSESAERFLHRYAHRLEDWAERLTRFVGDPDDLFEDVVVVLLEKWGRLRDLDDDEKLAYLYRAMANDVTDLRRHRGVVARVLGVVAASSPSTTASAEDDEARGRRARVARSELERLLADMPPVRRSVLRAHLADLTNPEIADLLDKKPGAIAQNLTRARRDIAEKISREVLAELFGEDPAGRREPHGRGEPAASHASGETTEPADSRADDEEEDR